MVPQLLQLQYTLGFKAVGDQIHVDVVRDQLTRSLNVITPVVMEELESAVPEYIPCIGDGELY